MNEILRILPGKLFATVVASLVCFSPFSANAYTCSVSAPAINVAFDPTSPANNTTAGTVNFTCQKQGNEGNNFNWSLGANDGANASGTQNRVASGGNFMNYNPFWSNGTTEWRGFAGAAASRITGTLVLPGGPNTVASGSANFLLIVTGNLSPWPAPGVYSDTVSVRMRQVGGTINPNPLTTAFAVNVTVPATCQITVPPGNVNFTYTSFQAAAAAASTTFGVRCTSTTPYAMSLDGTQPYNLLGLNYTLSLPGSGTGTGLTQTHTIDGSIAAGQPGTCATAACSGTQTRTLTIAY